MQSPHGTQATEATSAHRISSRTPPTARPMRGAAPIERALQTELRRIQQALDAVNRLPITCRNCAARFPAGTIRLTPTAHKATLAGQWQCLECWKLSLTCANCHQPLPLKKAKRRRTDNRLVHRNTCPRKHA